MALFKRKYMDNIFLFLTPLLLYPLLIEAKNINCNSKSFHCVNSTHFMICVDLGGGVSMTIDSFVIRCPPTTFCQETNYFECEYQASTTQKTKFDVTNGFADTNTLTATTETISSEVYQVYINGVNNAVTELVPNELDSEAIKLQGELYNINEIQTKNVNIYDDLVNIDNKKINNVFQGNLQNSSVYDLYSIEMELEQNKTIIQIAQYNMTNTQVNDSVYSMKKVINNNTKKLLFNETENMGHLKLNFDPIDLFTTLDNTIITPRDNIALENITTANELNLEHTMISDPIVTKMDLGENIGNTVLSNTSFYTAKESDVTIPVNDSDSNNARKNESACETGIDNELVNNIQLPSLNLDVYTLSQNNTFGIAEPSIDLNIKPALTTTSDMLSDTIIAETFSFGMYETNNNRLNNITTPSVSKGDSMTMKHQILENTQVTNPYRIEKDLRVYNKSVFTSPINITNTNVENLVHLNAKKVLTNQHIKELLSEGTENVSSENLNYEWNSIGESHVLSMTPENMFTTQTNYTTIQYITSDSEPILEITTISNPIVSPTHLEENTSYVISDTNFSETFTNVGMFFPGEQETEINGGNNDPITFVAEEKSTNTKTYKVEGGLNDVIKTIYNVNTSDDMIYANNLKNKNILQENHKKISILDSHNIEMKLKERNKNSFNIAPNNIITTQVEHSLDLSLRSNKTLINSHSHTKEFLSNKSDIISHQKLLIDAFTTNKNNISNDEFRTAAKSTTSKSVVVYKAKTDLPYILKIVTANTESSNEEDLKLNTNTDRTMGLRDVDNPYVTENFTEINFTTLNSENNEPLKKNVTNTSDQKNLKVSEMVIKQNLAKNTTTSPIKIFLPKNNEAEEKYTNKGIENIYNVVKKIYQPTSEKSIVRNSKTREFLLIADRKYKEKSYNKSKHAIEYAIQSTLETPIYLLNTSGETYTKERVNQEINIIKNIAHSFVGTSGIATSNKPIAINNTSDKKLYDTKIGEQENHNEISTSLSSSLTDTFTVINQTGENYKPVKERNSIILSDSRSNTIANLTQSFSEKSTSIVNRRQDTLMNVRGNQDTISDILTIPFTITDEKNPRTLITEQPNQISNLSKLLEANDSLPQVLSSQAKLSLFDNKLSKMLDNVKNRRIITLRSVGEYNLTQLDEYVTSDKIEDRENNNILTQQQFSDITTSLPNTQESSLIKYAPTTLSVTVNVLTGVNTQVKSKKISTISQYYDVFLDSNKKINTLSNKTLKQYCLNDTISNISLKNKLTTTEANDKSTRDSVETTNKLLTTLNKINNSYDEYNPTELVLKYKHQIIPTDKSYFAVNPFVSGYEINLTSEGNFNNVSTKIQSKEDKISDDRTFSYFTLYNNVSKSDTIYNNDLVKSVKGRKIITSTKTSRNHKQLLPNTLENASVELDDSSKIIKPIFNFNCRNRSRGRFADEGNCRKFYICIGIVAPILGLCPMNTVFSEFQQQCTRNLSHCVRKNQFQCVSEGRFIDVWEDNIYYICVKGTDHRFIRFKLQCQNGYRLDKMSLTCKNVKEIIKLSSSSLSLSLYDEDNKKISKTITKKRTDKNLFINNESFKCEKEGKFSDPSNCRRYYVCTKTSKSILRRKRKSCDSDEVFDKDKNKCVDQDSHEC